MWQIGNGITRMNRILNNSLSRLRMGEVLADEVVRGVRAAIPQLPTANCQLSPMTKLNNDAQARRNNPLRSQAR
jgi:hypothetical protein